MSIKNFIKKVIYFVFPHKIVKNRVHFESEGPYDNGYSLFQYAWDNMKDLDIYFSVPYANRKYIPEKYKKKIIYHYEHSSLGGHILNLFLHPIMTFKRLMLSNTFSHEFITYCHLLSSNQETKKIHLTHGIGVKGAANYVQSIASSFDKITLPSEFVIDTYAKYYGMPKSQFDLLPNCRKSQLDLDEETKNKFRKAVSAGNKKILLMMTTFRRNADDTFNIKKILPIDIDFNRMNDKLKKAGYVMVIKLHHALDKSDLSAFPKCSNIVFLKNKDIFALGLTPTSTLACGDALITDYSSVTFDYLFLNRPIGFLIPDFEQYKEEVDGGFIYDDPLSMLPGEKFVDQDNLEKFIDGLNATGEDKYEKERIRICRLVNGGWPSNIVPEKMILSHYCEKSKI